MSRGCEVLRCFEMGNTTEFLEPNDFGLLKQHERTLAGAVRSRWPFVFGISRLFLRDRAPQANPSLFHSHVHPDSS